MLHLSYKKIFISLILLIILVGVIIWMIPEKEGPFEEQVLETQERLGLEEDYEECRKVNNPFCIAVASEDEKKCDIIKDKKYVGYYWFVENYLSDDTKYLEKKILHCKNYIKMKKIFLKGEDCAEITEIDKKACEEMLVLRDLNDEGFSNYCKDECSTTYYFVSAFRTKESKDCDKIKDVNQKNMCKASVTNNPEACKELCDIAYQHKLTALGID